MQNILRTANIFLKKETFLKSFFSALFIFVDNVTDPSCLGFKVFGVALKVVLPQFFHDDLLRLPAGVVDLVGGGLWPQDAGAAG